MEINNPQTVEAQINKARQEAKLQKKIQQSTELQNTEEEDDNEDEDQSTTENIKLPKEPKEKLTGVLFWMILYVSFIKEFGEGILVFTIYFVSLNIITIISFGIIAYIYLFMQSISIKKRLISAIVYLVLELPTGGAFPTGTIVLALLKMSERKKYKAKVDRYLKKLEILEQVGKMLKMKNLQRIGRLAKKM